MRRIRRVPMFVVSQFGMIVIVTMAVRMVVAVGMVVIVTMAVMMIVIVVVILSGHVMGHDLLDPEVPHAVDRRFGQSGQKLAVGGALYGEDVAAVAQALLLAQRQLSNGSQGEAAPHEEEWKKTLPFHAHFPSR